MKIKVGKILGFSFFIFIMIFALLVAHVASGTAVNSTIKVGTNPDGVAYDSGKGEIFVINAGSNNVSVISDSTDTVVANVTVKANPSCVAYDFGMGEIFVTNGSDTVSVHI